MNLQFSGFIFWIGHFTFQLGKYFTNLSKIDFPEWKIYLTQSDTGDGRLNPKTLYWPIKPVKKDFTGPTENH